MEFLNEYISVVTLVVCLCVGYALKHAVTSDKVNKFIPTVVCLLGIAINIWANAWSFTPQIVAVGMVSGLASTGMHQLVKQWIESKTNA